MKIHQLDVAIHGDHYVYRSDSLWIKTDTWERRGADSVLGIGDSRRCNAPLLMNYMLNHPEVVEQKRVFEPFAGAGPNGLVAAYLGAASCDLLDLNPRAVEFMHESVEMSGLDPGRCQVVEGDIADFEPTVLYDVIFANPPFVPTPPCLAGVVHSNGGPDGCSATRVLLGRLSELLRPEGRALIWSLQIEAKGRPILADDLLRGAPGRPVEMMETTDCHIAFDRLTGCLIAADPASIGSILAWREDLVDQYGEDLTLNWYLIHVGADGSGKGLSVTSYDSDRYGAVYGPGPVDHLRRIQRLVRLEIMR